MSKITYRERHLINSTVINVFLDGSLVGTIKPDGTNFWAYWPKGSRTPGELMRSIAAVKRSIEG